MGLGSRLYNGETRFDIVGRARVWFALSGLVILAGLVSLGVRGLNLGIDFEGGSEWEVPAGEGSVEDVIDALAVAGVPEPTVQSLDTDGGRSIRVQTESLAVAQQGEVAALLAEVTGSDIATVTLTSVGASWGDEITSKATRALVFFLIAVTIYVTFRFELKMALATLLALLHDVLVTVGVYSLTGFEVTPATVIAILTILGYSIYDGIVVFDKVDENTRLVSSTNRVTYTSMVNLSLNQTLMRSLNTQITALLPMLSLLLVGSALLGATTLREFALALLIGQASGAYSSIFIASPALAMLKERESRFKDVRRRIEARDASSGAAPAVADAPSEAVAGEPMAYEPVDDVEADPVLPVAVSGPTTVSRPSVVTGTVIPPRPRKKKRR